MTKIMLVEDDKNLREIYGVRLLAEGYTIVTAGDGEEALAVAIKERPQLIITDIMMPRISGFDMLDILRSTPETRDMKVIVMTALSSEEQQRHGQSLGADLYLVKSQVGIEDVVRAAHELLGDQKNSATPPPPPPPQASKTTPAETPAPVQTTPPSPAPSTTQNTPTTNSINLNDLLDKEAKRNGDIPETSATPQEKEQIEQQLDELRNK